MKSIVVFWCFCIIGICYVYAIDGNRVDSLLLKLDQAIKERPIYMEQKELRLAKLKNQLLQSISEEEHLPFLVRYWMNIVHSIRILHFMLPRRGNR